MATINSNFFEDAISMGTITFDADIFIIPNHASKISDILSKSMQEEYLDNMRMICNINSCGFDSEKDHILETWYTNKSELDCGNIPDHSIHYRLEDGTRYTLVIDTGRYIPAKLFEDHKELDIVPVNLTATITKKYKKGNTVHTEVTENILATINFKLAQTQYRYSSFGNFEEVLNRVCY